MSLTPSFPLRGDETQAGGFAQVEQYRDLVRQNFRNLLLTAPGERAMNPGFGVGVKNFLFEQSTFVTKEALKAKINMQVALYLKYIKIENIEFVEENDQLLRLQIQYFIEPLGASDLINVNISEEGTNTNEF